MKKLLSLALLAGMLSIAPATQAAVQEFGPQSSRFTIDVPDGWQTVPRADGVIVNSADQKTSMALQVNPASGLNAKQFADAIAKELAKDPKNSVEKVEGDASVANIYYKAEGSNIAMIVMVTEGKAFTATMGGEDTNTLKGILDSIKDAKQ